MGTGLSLTGGCPENGGNDRQGVCAGDCRFPRKEKLKGRDGIREVFNRKRAVSCAGAKLFFFKNGLPHNRIAFTFSRKFGNAVERNRSRRLSREAYRYLRGALRQGYDMVLLVYPGRDAFQVRMGQLRGLFTRAGLLQPPGSPPGRGLDKAVPPDTGPEGRVLGGFPGLKGKAPSPD